MPKHGGCAICGSMKDEILTSVSGVGATSLALCKECLKTREQSGEGNGKGTKLDR